jgi:hypothetical protein
MYEWLLSSLFCMVKESVMGQLQLRATTRVKVIDHQYRERIQSFSNLVLVNNESSRIIHETPIKSVLLPIFILLSLLRFGQAILSSIDSTGFSQFRDRVAPNFGSTRTYGSTPTSIELLKATLNILKAPYPIIAVLAFNTPISQYLHKH